MVKRHRKQVSPLMTYPETVLSQMQVLVSLFQTYPLLQKHPDPSTRLLGQGKQFESMRMDVLELQVQFPPPFLSKTQT